MFSRPRRGIVDIRSRVLAHLSGVDTRISGGLEVAAENFFPTKPKDFSASFVSPCERPEISRHNG
jgi:hypothetical protein